MFLEKYVFGDVGMDFLIWVEIRCWRQMAHIMGNVLAIWYWFGLVWFYCEVAKLHIISISPQPRGLSNAINK